VQSAQKLALIFVNPLNLHVVKHICVKFYAVPFFKLNRQTLFCRLFVTHPFFLEFFVVRKFFKFFKLRQIGNPVFADFCRNEIGERAVCLMYPSARCYAVCFVVKLLGPKFVKVVKQSAFEQVGVKCRNAVNRETCNNRQISHTHHLLVAFFNNAHSAKTIGIAREFV